MQTKDLNSLKYLDKVDAITAFAAMKDNAVFQALMGELASAERRVAVAISEMAVISVSDFFAREQMVGELRGLRRMEKLLEALPEVLK